ncbi:hypothetical protein [Vibrio crassostreae]|uniref:hypothetical protein n=1 Tax=Vibrio crassostreae TaxID=246167 RepID=UPI001B30E404
MKKSNFKLKPLIISCLLSVSYSSFAAPYLYIDGYGENQQQAEKDAKEKLAFQMFSTVEVEETASNKYKTRTEFTNGEKQESGSHDVTMDTTSKISSIPINISNMELVKSSCDGFECKFEFRIHKDTWSDQLSRDIEQKHQLAKQYTIKQGDDWKSAVSFAEAERLLNKSHQSILVLTSLDNSAARLFHQQQIVLERKTVERIQNIDITIRTASDDYSKQLSALLADKVGFTSQGDIIVYIKGNVRKGRRNNKYIAKQELILKVFEEKNPNVAVSQKILSETGEASSKEKALEIAQDKITKIVSENSIYTLFN